MLALDSPCTPKGRMTPRRALLPMRPLARARRASFKSLPSKSKKIAFVPRALRVSDGTRPASLKLVPLAAARSNTTSHGSINRAGQAIGNGATHAKDPPTLQPVTILLAVSAP